MPTDEAGAIIASSSTKPRTDTGSARLKEAPGWLVGVVRIVAWDTPARVEESRGGAQWSSAFSRSPGNNDTKAGSNQHQAAVSPSTSKLYCSTVVPVLET